ncbi:MAG: hypothetical protein HC836_28640 [Richelia sp. RM2_1_2]|nr:hypothetical protein [Richelia sp. RM2_1_2]
MPKDKLTRFYSTTIFTDLKIMVAIARKQARCYGDSLIYSPLTLII